MATDASVTLESRIKGAIHGVAVGDALGGPVEFQRRGTFGKVTGYQMNMNFNLPPGCWTDDTSMTLCLAQSFITARTFSALDQLQNYIAWHKSGYLSVSDYCFDIGNLTLQTLGYWNSRLPRKNTNESSSSHSDHGPISDEALATLQTNLNKNFKRSIFCGNGSLMRTVPIGLFYFSSSPEEITKYSHLASELTHPYPTNGEACAAYCILVAYTLSSSPNTPSKQDMFAKFKEFQFDDPTLKSRFETYDTLADIRDRPEKNISSSGYVVNSLEAALWAFFSTDSYQEGCIRVVNLGDDADTVGAIYGGLAGAYYGLDAIPADWKEGLVKKEVVGRIADELYQVIIEREQQNQ
ncbi:hypothetical protein H072_949 [Dactylellina haptotyla CBS 200.50]|uniref:ADP-ribosylhydrolase ARH3 n=1 Tax=Dactylellina haptotyla (strain CBS 200.50) TaxID=1284197 RepID=S8BZY7_DACHA|nr:hypothetical protein H072_949 [Dactylellina haptotyla CBS 200.50]